MDDEGCSGPDDGGHAKPERLVSEFRIHGTLCMAVREDRMADALELWGGGDSESQAAMQVIGNCAVAGRRYLILSSPDGGEEAGETENAVADMLTHFFFCNLHVSVGNCLDKLLVPTFGNASATQSLDRTYPHYPAEPNSFEFFRQARESRAAGQMIMKFQMHPTANCRVMCVKSEYLIQFLGIRKKCR